MSYSDAVPMHTLKTDRPPRKHTPKQYLAAPSRDILRKDVRKQAHTEMREGAGVLGKLGAPAIERVPITFLTDQGVDADSHKYWQWV